MKRVFFLLSMKSISFYKTYIHMNMNSLVYIASCIRATRNCVSCSSIRPQKIHISFTPFSERHFNHESVILIKSLNNYNNTYELNNFLTILRKEFLRKSWILYRW